MNTIPANVKLGHISLATQNVVHRAKVPALPRTVSKAESQALIRIYIFIRSPGDSYEH